MGHSHTNVSSCQSELVRVRRPQSPRHLNHEWCHYDIIVSPVVDSDSDLISAETWWSAVLAVYYTEAEHESSQLYKYYTFLLSSQLFYQCYGSTSSDCMNINGRFLRGVNDVFWAGRLDWFSFLRSIETKERFDSAQNRARPLKWDSDLISGKPRLLRQTTEAESRSARFLITSLLRLFFDFHSEKLISI